MPITSVYSTPTQKDNNPFINPNANNSTRAGRLFKPPADFNTTTNESGGIIAPPLNTGTNAAVISSETQTILSNLKDKPQTFTINFNLIITLAAIVIIGFIVIKVFGD